jgi:hypothetical protein
MRALTLAIALVSAPAMAQVSVGAWEIEEVENGCMATTSFYRGSVATSLGLGQTLEGRSVMVLHNADWSTEADKSYDLYLLVDDEMFTGQAVGRSGGTLVLNLKPEVMRSIIRGSRMAPALKIDEHTERVLDPVKLTGSAAAMARVATCVAEVAAAKRRDERFPRDPFKR